MGSNALSTKKQRFSFPGSKLLHSFFFFFLFLERCFISFKETSVKISATFGENTSKIIKSLGEVVLKNKGPSKEYL